MPALARNIHGRAERQPDGARGHARGERLVGGAVADVTQHEPAHERTAVRLAELVVDGATEL